jgi:outer membrane PBP1 activator LpoA protein
MPHRIALAQWRRVWANAQSTASLAPPARARDHRREVLGRMLALAAAGVAPARAAEPQSGASAPIVAALLPLDGATFGRAAAAVQSGITAAWNLASPALRPQLLFVATGERPADALSGYSKALASGARVVIGPLIRDQASALTGALATQPPVKVPTLALNVPEVPLLPQNLFAFGLPAEDEARQIARIALGEGHRRAAILTQTGPFSRRLQQAFAEAFGAGGGQVVGTTAALTDPQSLARIARSVTTAQPDMLFLACDLAHARLVRPFIEQRLPTYATSHLWSGPIEPALVHDLDGTRLLDAPWLAAADHPAVMAYPRSQPALPPELERLYALGIDAWRLAEIALATGTLAGATIDGVTGRLEVAPDRRVRRDALPATLRQGRLEPTDPPR